MLDDETAEQRLARYKKELIDLQRYVVTKPRLAERIAWLEIEIPRISGQGNA
jgi:hypothetical protein